LPDALRERLTLAKMEGTYSTTAIRSEGSSRCVMLGGKRRVHSIRAGTPTCMLAELGDESLFLSVRLLARSPRGTALLATGASLSRRRRGSASSGAKFNALASSFLDSGASRLVARQAPLCLS